MIFKLFDHLLNDLVFKYYWFSNWNSRDLNKSKILILNNYWKNDDLHMMKPVGAEFFFMEPLLQLQIEANINSNCFYEFKQISVEITCLKILSYALK